MFGNDREALRRTFQEAWRKHCNGQPLEALEAQIVAVVERHPEYHPVVASEAGLARDFHPEQGEVNPYLHMAMHLALEDQRRTDRPPGIAAALAAVERRQGERHGAEHAAMECLGRVMWEAQAAGRAPDEQDFLNCVRRLAGGS